MQTLTLKEIRAEEIKLVLSRNYFAFPKGIEVCVIGEMDGERRGENEIILRPLRSHETFTMREEIFWDHVTLPDEVD